MPKSVTASLEALLKAEVSQRIAEVKTVTDSVIEQIRMAAGRCIAELEHLADRIASGEVEVEVEQHEQTPVATPVAPAAPQAPQPSAAGAGLAQAGSAAGIARATWIPYGSPLPDYGSIGPAGVR